MIAIAFKNLQKSKWDKEKPEYRIFARDKDGKISRKPIGAAYKRKDRYGNVSLTIYIREGKEYNSEGNNSISDNGSSSVSDDQ